jgi:HlyD family secretion protein
VEIITGARASVVRVPSAALRFRPRESDRPKASTVVKKGKRPQTVWLASADPYKPVRRVVSVGLRGEDHAEIVRGLRPGEKVLVRSRSLEKKKEDPDEQDEEAEEEEQQQ